MSIDSKKKSKASCKNCASTPKYSHNAPDDIHLNATRHSITRRDFLTLSTISMGFLGCISFFWTFLSSLWPSDNDASETLEVSLKDVLPGTWKTILWNNIPIFIRHRTHKEIQDAQKGDYSFMIDPQKDAQRVHASHPQWLVVKGICTHLGCIPVGSTRQIASKYNGWHCPCHGSQYDISGRVIRGPAPKNLEVPPYSFIQPDVIRLGSTHS